MRLKVEANDLTEDLLQFILSEIDDHTLDEVEVDRVFSTEADLVSEPFTTAAYVTISISMLTVIARLIERWLEKRRQIDTLRLVADVNTDDARKILADLAAKYSEVSVSYTLPTRKDLA